MRRLLTVLVGGILAAGWALAGDKEGRRVGLLEEYAGGGGNAKRWEKVFGKPPQSWIGDMYVTKVLRVPVDGDSGYLAVFGDAMGMVPSSSNTALQLFSRRGERKGSWKFPTGHRAEVAESSWEHSTELGRELLVLRSWRQINGRDVGKAYFELLPGRVRLVRLESTTGRAQGNVYFWEHYRFGPRPSGTAVEEWLRLLQSRDDGDVLEALVFLGGLHTRGDPNEPPAMPELLALFEETIADERVRVELERLKRSGSAWIREAAELALVDPAQRRW